MRTNPAMLLMLLRPKERIFNFFKPLRLAIRSMLLELRDNFLKEMFRKIMKSNRLVQFD